MKKSTIFLKLFFPVLLTLIVGFLAFKNYTPDTILSGWDTLHPEFNFQLAFERAFNGVWREEQGVGAIAAHAHMSDLPRIVMLWVSSVFLPLSFLRYFFFFVTLLVGPLGVFFFLRNIFSDKKKIVSIPPFLGASLYLLNLGTLQHYYVPFEMFATAYAAIPWIYLAVFKYLKDKKKTKNLGLIILVSFLATPMAFAPSLFYAFFAGLVLFLTTFIYLNKNKKRMIKKSFITLSLILVANSFWLLPNLYSIAKQSQDIKNSLQNTLFSQDGFLRNKEYGQIKNVLIHKNFLFSWQEHDFNNKEFVKLLEEWNDHLKAPFVLQILYLISAFSAIGLLVGVLKKDKVILATIPVLLLSLFFLLNDNPPFGFIYSALRNNFGIFSEGFRMPFTKFSIPFMFILSVYFAYLFNWILSNKKKLIKGIGVLLGLIALYGMVYTTLPMFKGNLMSPSQKVVIPNEYQELFNWFNTQPKDARIARLPLHTPYGWNYHTWGYQGVEFLAFGIKQPILDRDYDRWSPLNEGFYNEASWALYADDFELLEKVLKKYDVKYLLLDESVVNPGGNPDIPRIDEIKKWLGNNKDIRLSHNSGFLSVYETSTDQSKDYIWSPKSYIKANSDLTYSQYDPLYDKYSDYISNPNAIIYPFANLDNRVGLNIDVEEDIVKLISKPLPFGDGEILVFPGNEKLDIFVNEKKEVVVRNKVDAIVSEDFSQENGYEEAYNCDLSKEGEVIKRIYNDRIEYEAYNNGVSCDFFGYSELSYKNGYALRIKGKNLEGRGVKFYLFNNTTKKVDLEKILPEGDFDQAFFILPRNLVGNGYTLNIETRAFGRIASKNTINLIQFIPVDTSFLAQIKYGKPAGGFARLLGELDNEPQIIKNNLEVISTKKAGSVYKVKTTGNGALALNQGYEEGWLAFANGKILPHIKVNGWANGWNVEGDSDITILYWPQLLQYFGFAILVGGFIYILRLTKGKATN